MTKRLLVAMLVLLVAAPASAAINGYRLFKGINYSQASDDSASVSFYSGGFDIIAGSSSDFSAAQVVKPDSSMIPLQPFGPTFYGAGFGFGTLAELDSFFPTNAGYEYQISGGSLGSQSATLTTVGNHFGSEVPRFTGDTFSRLQSYDVNAPLALTWSEFNYSSAINDAAVFLNVSRVSDGQNAFSTVVSPTTTSVELPAGALEYDTAYNLSLVQSARINTSNAGFGGATATLGFDSRVDLQFTTLPPPPPLEVAFYRLFKTFHYEQTSSAMPIEPYIASAALDVISADPSHVLMGTVASASPLSPMTLTPQGPGYAVFSRSFSNLAQFYQEIPNGAAYEYEVAHADYPSTAETATLITPNEDLFSPQKPVFTGATYNNLQSMDAAEPFVFTINGFTPLSGVSSPVIFFSINRISDGQSVFGTSGPPTMTSITLPANSLSSDTEYYASLTYSSRVDVPDAGFNGATSQVAFDRNTIIRFMTAEPAIRGDYNDNGSVGPEDLAVWRTAFGLTLAADGDGDGDSDGSDLLLWQRQLGAVAEVAQSVAAPEPTPLALLPAAALMFFQRCRKPMS